MYYIMVLHYIYMTRMTIKRDQLYNIAITIIAIIITQTSINYYLCFSSTVVKYGVDYKMEYYSDYTVS